MKQAMIFAAGRGTRLKPLTDAIPKPLIEVKGQPLIMYHLEKMQALGIESVVINVSHLGQQIIDLLGDGARWGLQIHYSVETTPLETAGGLVHARHLLQDGPFLLVNADIFCSVDFRVLLAQPRQSLHVLMVPNPLEQPMGNFLMTAKGLIYPLTQCLTEQRLTEQLASKGTAYTYGGIGIFSTEFIDSIDLLESGEDEHQRTPFYMKRWMRQEQVSGMLYTGQWVDIGTPERLSIARAL